MNRADRQEPIVRSDGDRVAFLRAGLRVLISPNETLALPSQDVP
ncbi:MAG TPA: hypothetical protein VK474_07400 [Chthoniobacterales bacterium]|nr:hypothetical protein [Chthoniobacterales bacterium]